MELKSIAKEIRSLTLECVASLGVGHIGGALSITDLLAVLYYGEMNIDPGNPDMENRDRLVVSKGHAGPAVYAALAHKGYFPKEELLTLNKLGTKLPSHCDMNLTTGIDMTTGSLGQGFSCAVGMAVGSKIKKDGAYIFTVIGDGESQEGQVWEAAMLANQRNLDNLIAFTDSNKLQIDGTTDEVNSLSNLAGRWTSFGWNTQEIDGHDIDEIISAIKNAKTTKGKPNMIIMNTVKGRGVSFIEAAKAGNHSMNLSQDDLVRALGELV